MAILSFSGNAQKFVGKYYPRKKFDDGSSQASPDLWIFDERQNVFLDRDIKITPKNPLYVELDGVFANYKPANQSSNDLPFDWDISEENLSILSSGITVDSHLIAFFAPYPANQKRFNVEVTIEFSGPIIGLIDSGRSDLTNDLFSPTSYKSPGQSTLEGLQWENASQRDYYKIVGPNNNILQIRQSLVRRGYEHVRVLTLASGSQPTPVQTFTGDGGANILEGTGGADILVALAGNDTYIVNDINDEVIEELNQGTDTVKSSITYTLTNNVENLTLLGTTNLNGTGNDLNNTLTGNIGNNILIGLDGNDIIDGKAGADTMQGGSGNDTYTVDNIGDVVTENLNAGTDTVKASISYTLDANVENLTLLGSENLNGTGNDLKNSIRGNSGDNILNGGVGADTLTSGAGNDILIFQFGQSTVNATDRILDFEIGIDKIDLLTQGGAAMGDLIAFSRAADATVWNMTQMVNTVFADANGALEGNQALGLNSAVLVQGKSAPCLIVNDGVAGFQAANDLVINLQGFKGTLPDFGAIAVEQFFV
jgi:hypothetical protein